MLKRLFLSVFFALVISGIAFYLAFFAGLIYAAISGPSNPANDPGLQTSLRHWALPISSALGCLSFILAFRRLGRAGQRP